MDTKKIASLLAAALLAGALVSAAPVAPAAAASSSSAATYRPMDYTKIKGLSQPKYETVRDVHEVPMEDGVHLYVEVVRPKAPGRFPVILELAPYHGTLADRDGTRILPGPKDAEGNAIGLTGYFAPRGYAVVMVDLRGTGRSEGCLDHLGPLDQSDSKEIVEWAAEQKWSNGRVGMTGHSYVGSTPQMAAAQNPKGLKTIVPSAGLAAMYHHEFQNGVPYNLQWAGPLFAYEVLAIQRHLPPGTPVPAVGGTSGDNFGNDMQYFGCGATQSAAVTGEAFLSGAETDWHRERDFRKGVTKSKIPIFLVHGVNDNAARIPATDWFINRGGRKGDKAWIGQWDHGSGRFPNSRTCEQTAAQPCTGDQWTAALHAWFEKHLMGKNVQTGPPVEVFLNDGSVYTPGQWPPPVKDLKFHANADGSLAPKSGESGSVSYVADPRGMNSEFNTGSVIFETAPFKKDTLIAGIPELKLSASLIGERVHIVATMYDVQGERVDRMAQAGFAIQPELRNGIDEPAPVIPTEVMTMDIEGMSQAHLIEKGHRLRLIVASSHPDKVPTLAAGTQVTVHTGGETPTILTLPVIPNYRLYADPMGPR